MGGGTCSCGSAAGCNGGERPEPDARLPPSPGHPGADLAPTGAGWQSTVQDPSSRMLGRLRAAVTVPQAVQQLSAGKTLPVVPGKRQRVLQSSGRMLRGAWTGTHGSGHLLARSTIISCQLPRTQTHVCLVPRATTFLVARRRADDIPAAPAHPRSMFHCRILRGLEGSWLLPPGARKSSFRTSAGFGSGGAIGCAMPTTALQGARWRQMRPGGWWWRRRGNRDVVQCVWGGRLLDAMAMGDSRLVKVGGVPAGLLCHLSGAERVQNGGR